MKRIACLLCALGAAAVLAGCVGYVPVPAHGTVVYQDGGHHRPPPRAMRDRDGDGVPNRHDRRPNNPYRY